MRPITVFLLTFVFVAPAVAIAGVAATPNWAAASLMVAGGLVVWTGRRALIPIREEVSDFGGIRMRMMAVAWSIVAVAALLSAGRALWLVWRLV